jgi:hypothetical protein
MSHDNLCVTFHKKDMPAELCRNCDALAEARMDERRRVAEQIHRLLKTYPHMDTFSEGYTFALERAVAVVRSA